jgi:hypothetical protein
LVIQSSSSRQCIDMPVALKMEAASLSIVFGMIDRSQGMNE